MSSQFGGVGPSAKSLLRNVIRHTDTHNRLLEEAEMWQMHSRIRKGQDKNSSLSNDSERRHNSHIAKDRSPDDTGDLDIQKSFLFDDRSGSYDGSSWRRAPQRAHMDEEVSEGSKVASTFWMRQLQKAEEGNPDRWGHGGYKELYPSDFDSDKSGKEKLRTVRSSRKRHKKKFLGRSRRKRSSSSDKKSSPQMEKKRRKKLKKRKDDSSVDSLTRQEKKKEKKRKKKRVEDSDGKSEVDQKRSLSPSTRREMSYEKEQRNKEKKKKKEKQICEGSESNDEDCNDHEYDNVKKKKKKSSKRKRHKGSENQVEGEGIREGKKEGWGKRKRSWMNDGGSEKSDSDESDSDGCEWIERGSNSQNVVLDRRKERRKEKKGKKRK